ncbi:MAG: signal peptidase II [Paludibacteraceae bacterium]|nr:signal peptidase II [Paludibacteraceae bacterium]
MQRTQKQSIMVAAIILLMVALDQATKLLVHHFIPVGDCLEVLPFFYLCHVLNDGMAFGIEWFDKLFLTLFRLVAVVLLGWYMHRLIRSARPVKTGYIATIAFVTAGALGNIIDCLFYGKMFGYAPLFYGKVIDMLYFPLITNSAGECLFFQPVFNIADSCITVAVIVILLWYRKELK